MWGKWLLKLLRVITKIVNMGSLGSPASSKKCYENTPWQIIYVCKYPQSTEKFISFYFKVTNKNKAKKKIKKIHFELRADVCTYFV